MSEQTLAHALLHLSSPQAIPRLYGDTDTARMNSSIDNQEILAHGHTDSVDVLVGTIKISNLELVNEFAAQGPTGPTPG